jgi:hypothetical protein
MNLRPPHVSEDEKPLRRKVAMAYRAACEAGMSDFPAREAAMAVYLGERPETRADTFAASGRVAEMIASAINMNPDWFWKNLRRR